MAFCPSTWDTRAAIGTAETPAEPINGLTLPPESQYMSFPNNNPPTVLKLNAKRPRPMIISVSSLRKVSAFAVAPTVTPRNIVTILINAFWAVSLSLSTTPDSLKRLPSMSIPIRGATEGRSSTHRMVTTMGKRIFSNLETSLSCSILVSLSFLVVRSLMRGG